MSEENETSEIQQWLLKLQEECKQAEAKYGEMLTIVDQQSKFPLPHEIASRLIEIKDALNRSWDISANTLSAAEQETRIFWNEVARNIATYLRPLIEEQRQFNGAVVHLLNDFIASVTQSLAQIREFHHFLVLYFQKFIPVIDAKFRESVAIQESSITAYGERIRDTVNLLYQELDRRIETLQTEPRSENAPGKNSPRLQKPVYYQFEEEFRGTRESIKDRFSGYIKYFQNDFRAPILDLGCGRGEFLDLLKAASLRGIGVDSNTQMIQKCRELGLEVWEGDLLDFLESQQPDSLAGIFCSQVVEHLPAQEILRLLQSAYNRLKKGAPLIVETVNVASAFSFLQVYTRDLTHQTPCHPETLKFLFHAYGFQKAEIIYKSPVPSGAKLELMKESSDDQKTLLNENIRRLNKLLFDSQEYAVIANK